MNSTATAPDRQAPLLVWWIIWFLTLSGLIAVSAVFGPKAAPSPPPAVIDVISFVPLIGQIYVNRPDAG